MFDFMFMRPKPIARFELPDVFGRQGLIVDTVGGISDSEHSYETAVAHPEYNDGKWIIVEGYDTEKDARAGHEKWVKTMTADNLPNELRDVSTATVAELAEALGSEFRRAPRTIDITPPDQLALPE